MCVFRQKRLRPIRSRFRRNCLPRPILRSTKAILVARVCVLCVSMRAFQRSQRGKHIRNGGKKNANIKIRKCLGLAAPTLCIYGPVHSFAVCVCDDNGTSEKKENSVENSCGKYRSYGLWRHKLLLKSIKANLTVLMRLFYSVASSAWRSTSLSLSLVCSFSIWLGTRAAANFCVSPMPMVPYRKLVLPRFRKSFVLHSPIGKILAFFYSFAIWQVFLFCWWCCCWWFRVTKLSNYRFRREYDDSRISSRFLNRKSFQTQIEIYVALSRAHTQHLRRKEGRVRHSNEKWRKRILSESRKHISQNITFHNISRLPAHFFSLSLVARSCRFGWNVPWFSDL